jgi:hypothetical protein
MIATAERFRAITVMMAKTIWEYGRLACRT